MKPYENESEVLRIGGLQFENRLDRITVSGDIDLTRDKAGLADARALQALLERIVGALEAAQDLPAALPPPRVKRVSNPFE
jgi:hypothetical protein